MTKKSLLFAVCIQFVFALPQGLLPRDYQDDPALVASVSSAVSLAGLKPYATPLATDEIKEWGAYGDSFTAGIGSNGLKDYIDYSESCSRYKKAYPMQMNPDTRWPGNAADRKLNFGACTGNRMTNVRDNQVCVVASQPFRCMFGSYSALSGVYFKCYICTQGVFVGATNTHDSADAPILVDG